jgi:hypothetical protein
LRFARRQSIYHGDTAKYLRITLKLLPAPSCQRRLLNEAHQQKRHGMPWRFCLAG